MNRRQFLASSIAASVVPAVTEFTASRATASGRRSRILLRSSWQTVNIGDIAHTPGVLKLLETYLPNVEIHLWPSKLDNGVDKLLSSHFPNLKIAQSANALEAAFATCDFLLHGSGASLVAEKDVVRWHEETGKPYGVYGITLPPKKSSSTVATSEAALAKTVEVLSKARFVFFRDSKSLSFAKEKGCTCPLMDFGPDGAFACDLRDDVKAEAFLRKHSLEPGRFLCCIPRLRYTPYWTIPSKQRPFDAVKHARNESMKEHDHAPLRLAIIEIARQTHLKILLCPEDQTQMRIGKELLLDKLPHDVRHRVVWRPNYWLTGEAISTYIRSAGLFGNEMHSPIMCVGHGIPAIVCRWAEQTTKGYMWEDIGLGDWLFNLDDESDVARIVPTVLALASNQESAKVKAEKAQRFVQKRQRETMAHLASELA
jgi:hypothetical protein